MKRRRQRPEDALQRSVAQFLDLALPADACWFSVPNGGARSPIEAGILKATGVKPGAPDLLIFHAGRCFAIELKAPPRTLKNGALSRSKPPISEPQHLMHARLQRAGVAVCVGRTLEEVEAFLRETAGIALRGCVGVGLNKSLTA